jgi:hypothetical protein
MKTILFYPEIVDRRSRVYRICKENGIPFHNDPNKYYDLHIFWSYTPRSIVPPKLTLEDKKVINRGCWDISKGKVHSVFNDISVDPTKWSGKCVQKLDRQGRHDGHSVINCPIEKPLPGYVYEKFIEDTNSKTGDYIKYRVYFGKRIHFILRQEKPSVFGSDYTKHEFIDKRSVFTKEQEDDFLNKCGVFGVDYADIEFIYNRGVPIIIDVNNVAGPPYYTTQIKKEMDNTFLNLIKEWPR